MGTWLDRMRKQGIRSDSTSEVIRSVVVLSTQQPPKPYNRKRFGFPATTLVVYRYYRSFSSSMSEESFQVKR